MVDTDYVITQLLTVKRTIRYFRDNEYHDKCRSLKLLPEMQGEEGFGLGW